MRSFVSAMLTAFILTTAMSLVALGFWIYTHLGSFFLAAVPMAIGFTTMLCIDNIVEEL